MFVTFYSFKGGVGRSMALANIARWFQLCGLNVTAVDWDLEAPGLESFFHDEGAVADSTSEQLGLVDLLSLYRQIHPNLGFAAAPPAGAGSAGEAAPADADLARLRQHLPTMQHTLIDIAAPADRPTQAGASPASQCEPGVLKLLGAGWRGGDRFTTYANTVQSFDWNDFYASFHGRAYFEWLRESLCGPDGADIVLIDSRTGVTEMGGVCTRQMADVVVVLAAPNQQNIDGSRRMAESFRRPQVMREREWRPLDILMVPSRVDMSSEMKDRFAADFAASADAFMPAELAKLERRFWDLRIPYITKYAYREQLAVGVPDGDSDILAAYRAIAAHIAWLAPEDSRVHRLMRLEFEHVFGVERTRIYLTADRLFARAIALLDDSEQLMARRILTRLVTVAPEDAGGHDAPRLVAMDLFDDAHRRLILQLVESGLIRHAEGKRQLIGLANEDLVSRSDLKQWLAADRAFLVWRQNLRTYIDDWESTRREDAALLQGSLLETALRMRASRPAPDLAADEHEFIQRSEDGAQRRQAALDLAAQVRPGAPAHPMQTQPASAARRPYRWLLGGLGLALAAGALVFALSPQRPGVRPVPLPDMPPVVPAGPAPAQQVEDLVKLGQAQLANGAAADATASFSRALAVDPRSQDALLGRATALSDTGDAKSALADLDGLASAGVATPAALYRRGKVHEQLGDDKSALADYGAAIKASDGSHAAALFARGSVCERLGDRRCAIADFGAATRVPGEELTRTAAQARLTRLVPTTPPPKPPPAARPLVRLMVSDPDDMKTAAVLAETLRRSGYQLSGGAQALPAPLGQGYVRYATAADADVAGKLRDSVQETLARTGYPTKLRLVGPADKAGSAGPLVVALPPLAFPSGKR